jgi:oligopeptide transport system substrate-binding protein
VASDRPDVHLVPMAGTYFYNFNCLPRFADGTENPLHDWRVRRALSMAIDRRTIVAQVTRLNQPVARSFIPPLALPDYQPPVDEGATYEPEVARQLLAEAGYPGGEGLEGLSILYNTGFGHENIAQVIARTWEQDLGVVVTLEGVESRVFGDRLKTQQFAIARAGWFGDYRDATTFLGKHVTGDGNNDAAWSNPQYDALMTEASTERDRQRRTELLESAEAILLQRQPIAPIFHYADVQVFDPDVMRHYRPNPWAFRRLDRVTIAR